MSDNPYERDNPYEPVDPDPQASGTGSHRADAEAHTQRINPTGTADDAPGRARAQPAPDQDEARTQLIATQLAPGDATARDTVVPGDGVPGDGAEPTVVLPADPDGAVTSTFDVREAERRRSAADHQAERPVQRSALTEHRSAARPTGEHPPRRAAEPTRPIRTSDEGGPWLAGGAGGVAAAEPARTERDVALEGSTALTRPRSRAGAHVLTVLLSLLLTPVAWYLLADAGARLTIPPGNPWETGDLNPAALLELIGGLLVLAVVVVAARWSSLGAIITGSLVLVLGAAFVVAPSWTRQALEPVAAWLGDLGAFGDNLTSHLVASGSTGRLVVHGLALVLIGVVSHGARRQGRREVRALTT